MKHEWLGSHSHEILPPISIHQLGFWSRKVPKPQACQQPPCQLKKSTDRRYRTPISLSRQDETVEAARKNNGAQQETVGGASEGKKIGFE